MSDLLKMFQRFIKTRNFMLSKIGKQLDRMENRNGVYFIVLFPLLCFISPTLLPIFLLFLIQVVILYFLEEKDKEITPLTVERDYPKTFAFFSILEFPFGAILYIQITVYASFVFFIDRIVDNVSCRIKMFGMKKKLKPDERCPVCFEYLTDYILPCGHQIHVKNSCYKWITKYNNCPICRKSFKTIKV